MGIKTIIKTVWITILVAIVSKRGNATLNMKPSDAVVLQNGSTFFNCSTFNFSSGSEEIAWYHSVGSFPRKDVYEDGEIRTNYEGRFRVEKDLSRGIVNLVVQAPNLEDGGKYECQDGIGIGDTAHAQLIVLETEPVCRSNIQPDGVIGSNDCGINPDQVEMSCSVKYRGNIPVHLEWRNRLEDDNSSLAVAYRNTTNRSTCNLTVTGDRVRNNSVYVCQIKDTETNTYSCSSDVIKILYVKSDNTTISVNGKEEFRCSVKSNQQCSYTWYSGEKNVSVSESLKPSGSGQYLCKANCNIRGQVCIVTASNLNVSSETARKETSKAGMIAGVTVSLVMAVAISIIVGVWIWRRQHKRRREKIRAKGQPTQQAPMHEPEQQPDQPPEQPIAHEENELESLLPQIKREVTAHDMTRLFCGEKLMHEGLIGGVYGPWTHKGNQCAVERIMCLAETDKVIICRNGQKWIKLIHDNLIKFHDVIEKPRSVYIVMEYTQGGSVRKAVGDRTKDITIPLVKDWSMQIAQGMEYLHEKDIVHKDLGCDQIFILEHADVSRKTLKIACFNLLNGEFIRSDNNSSATSYACWSPEECQDRNCSKESDVWSFGNVIWEMLTRTVPYAAMASKKVIDDICDGAKELTVPETCPEELKNILKECRKTDHLERPSFTELLRRLRDWQLLQTETL